MCDRVTVLYAGQVVEMGEVHELFRRPRHPYTAGLLAAMPQRHVGDGELASIPGRVPPPDQMPDGCRFHTRCPYAVEGVCTSTPVAIAPVPDGGIVRCVRSSELDLREDAGARFVEVEPQP